MESDWKAILINIFCAYINQNLLEAGAEAMVFVSMQDSTIHLEFLNAFDQGIRMAKNEDDEILKIFSHSSGHTANSFADARHLLEITRKIYLDAYKNKMTNYSWVDD